MPFAFLGGLLRSHVSSSTRSCGALDELRASRARLVEAGDAERRRLERDLHDGAQSRLVGAGAAAARGTHARRRRRRARGAARPGAGRAADEPGRAARAGARDPPGRARPTAGSSRRSHGARGARAGAGHASRPTATSGCPPPVESAAYFVVSEALVNVAKYACATPAPPCAVRRANGERHRRCQPTTASAAPTPTRGSGLRGLADRVAALDGTLAVESPRGGGTRLRAELPL